MQKIFLLLRYNRQLGPFNLDELLQQKLLPTDLIWIEGKSAAWSYPSEIKELQPYFNKTTTPTDNEKAEKSREQKTAGAAAQKEKKVFVSLPAQQQSTQEEAPPPAADVLEQKAEALRKRAMEHNTAAAKPTIPQLETKLQRSVDELTDDYTHWTLKKQKEKKTFTNHKQALFTAALLLIIVFCGWWLFADKNSQPAAATDEIITANSVTPSTAALPEPSGNVSAVSEDVPVNNKPERQIKSGSVSTTTPAEKEQESVLQEPVEFNHSSTEPPQPENNSITDDVDATVEAPEEKRKTIGQAIGGFFEKLKGKNNDPNEPAQQGERRSTKRTESTGDVATTADITEKVKLTANTPATNWMLGVKGLKLTLHNQSNLPLQNAVVQIQYFDEEETLLEEKSIEFGNIKPGQKATLPAPEHRLASFTRQQVIAATGRVE